MTSSGSLATEAAPTARLGGALRSVWRRLRGTQTPLRLGLSLGLGLFIGCQPVYGLHLALCLLLCVPLRLDAAAAYLGANVSNPVVAPFLLFAEVELGSLVLDGVWLDIDPDRVRALGPAALAMNTAVGSLIVGLVLGVLGGGLAVLIAARGRAQPELLRARRATVKRYRAAPFGDRVYVALKLATDPLVAALVELGPLGDVLDAGCGRGQFGLFLQELGRLNHLSGFDHDARKLGLAEGAARGQARFSVADLQSHRFEPVDTILLLDVLHYLGAAEEDQLLARATHALRPHGRLVIRDVGDRKSWSRALTRALERVLSKVGYQRATAPLAFRSMAERARKLRALGLEVSIKDASAGTPFDNQLLVATRQ